MDYPHSKRALLDGNSVAITGNDTDKLFLLVNGIQQYVTINCLVSVNLQISVKHRLPCKATSS